MCWEIRGGEEALCSALGMAGATPGGHTGTRLLHREGSSQMGLWPHASHATLLLWCRDSAPSTCVTGDTRGEQGENGQFSLFQKYHKLTPVEKIQELQWERASPSREEQVTFLSMR